MGINKDVAVSNSDIKDDSDAWSITPTDQTRSSLAPLSYSTDGNSLISIRSGHQGLSVNHPELQCPFPAPSDGIFCKKSALGETEWIVHVAMHLVGIPIPSPDENIRCGCGRDVRGLNNWAAIARHVLKHLLHSPGNYSQAFGALLTDYLLRQNASLNIRPDTYSRLEITSRHKQTVVSMQTVGIGGSVNMEGQS